MRSSLMMMLHFTILVFEIILSLNIHWPCKYQLKQDSYANELWESIIPREHGSTCKIVVNGLRAGWKTEEPNLVNFLKQLHPTNPLIQFQTLLFLVNNTVLPVILRLYLSKFA
ncbi:uncharacterized protein LOC128295307 [Gossypium arboreum]|uniref:uncharacterized protein LOC128295307 n=1 Tax=Gossypium arboreum TaxID=29729 RepID=UPI0022F1DBFF|nr:uncharacterized protein LOC128295307 [Gossypium arboreum]